jgi:hypothetical protein
MPNFCNNFISLSNGNSDLIDMIFNGDKKQVLQSLLPCPKELCDDEIDDTPPFGAERENKLKEKYGFYHADEWRKINWGTKWDLSGVEMKRVDDNTLEIRGYTAWAPPIEAFVQLQSQGYNIYAMYYESGMGFAGIWEDGVDLIYKWDSVENAKELPECLEKEFHIYEYLKSFEDEDRIDNE